MTTIAQLDDDPAHLKKMMRAMVNDTILQIDAAQKFLAHSGSVESASALAVLNGLKSGLQAKLSLEGLYKVLSDGSVVVFNFHACMEALRVFQETNGPVGDKSEVMKADTPFVISVKENQQRAVTIEVTSLEDFKRQVEVKKSVVTLFLDELSGLK